MKNIILILLVILISSCEQSEFSKENQYKTNQKYFQNIINGCHVVTRDGCQYLIDEDGHSGFLAHKGDCKNKIHNHE